MKKKKTVSVILSAVFGVVGIAFFYNFFRNVHRNVFDLLMGFFLIFLAIYNIYLTLKHIKAENR